MSVYQVEGQFINDGINSEYQVNGIFINEPLQTVFDKTGSDTLTFTQLSKLQSRPTDGANTLTFGQVLDVVLFPLLFNTNLYQVEDQLLEELGDALYQVSGVFVNESVTLSRFITQTVTFSQLAKLQVRPVDATQTATFSQVLSKILRRLFSETQTVTFSQSAAVLPSVDPASSNTVTFSQSAINSLLTLALAQTITFTQLGSIPLVQILTASDTVTFSQVLAAIAPQFASDTVTFSHVGGAGVIIPGGIEKTALPGTVTFSQAVLKVLILGSATDLSASDGLDFTQNTITPIEFSIPQSFVLTDSTIVDFINSITQEVTFSQLEADPKGTIRPRTVAQTLSFSHAMAFINRIDECRYSPAIGAGTDPSAPAPPPASLTITKQSTITLSHPTVSPTLTVSIRAPEFGETHRLNFNRINRESRGGTLQVFADPAWPKFEILEASFTALKEAEAQAVLTFFKQTLGLEVKLVDWYGKTWHGVITTPEAPLIRARRGIVDLSFEFEGDVQ